MSVTTTHPRRARRATIAGLVLTALAAGTVTATAAPASATASGREMGVRIWSMPTTAAQNLTTAEIATSARASTTTTAASVWIDVASSVAGARVRTRPINGTVLRLMPYQGRAWALCRVPMPDGFDWTFVRYAGIQGWVRNDLIYPVQYTTPNAPPFRLVPRC